MLGLSVYSYEIHTYVRTYMHTYVAVSSRNRILVELDSFEIFTLFYSYAYVDYFLQVWYLFVLLLQSYKRTVFACLYVDAEYAMVCTHLSAIVLKLTRPFSLN